MFLIICFFLYTFVVADTSDRYFYTVGSSGMHWSQREVLYAKSNYYSKDFSKQRLTSISSSQ